MAKKVQDDEREDWLPAVAGASALDGQLWPDKPREPSRIKVIPPTQAPQDAAELERCLQDPEWRLFSGCLYQIIVKGKNEGDDDLVQPFIPNRAQKRFIRRLWHRNIILKARQLGFTTLIAILWLDHALFNGNQRCGMIAQDRETAEAIFRDKVVFAYDHLPEELRERFPLARASTKELLFGHNNSSIRVATSVRGGTIHRLHVSEFGKICAKFPAKANEVVTGSIQAVPLSGILVIESTAEGTEGEFYDMCQRAQALVAGKAKLTASQYRFHFYAWWQDPAYTMDPAGVAISNEQHDYFNEIEQTCNCKIDTGQRAWYVEKLRNDFSGKEERMWQEYPSTPEEAFQQSTAGHYYAKDMVLLRKRGAICQVPVLDLPVYTFWDIGNSDGTAIWLHQQVQGLDRFFGFIEGWEMPYSHYVLELQKVGLAKGIVWGNHHLPHDADHKRQQAEKVTSPKEELESLKAIGGKWIVVPRVEHLTHGINLVRKKFSGYAFDAEGCKDGLVHIGAYRKKWNRSTGGWSSEPFKDKHTEAADALRQHAQGYVPPNPAAAETFAAFKNRNRRRGWS